jgi:hypothetical protein
MEVFSMGRRLTVVAVTIFLGASGAWAQSPAPKNSLDSEYTDTVYTSDQHMGFSIRTTIVQWLGGVDVAREKDAKAAQKEGWWGEFVPQVPPELAQAPKSDR